MRKITHKVRSLPNGCHIYKVNSKWIGYISNKHGHTKTIESYEFGDLIDRLLILTRRKDLKGEKK